MSKVRAAQAVFALGGSQGIIIPSVGAGESNVQVITLEGSSSMYDPVSKLSNLLKENGQPIEVNILPSGTSGGKESLSSKEIDFILASIDEREKKSNPYTVRLENSTTSEDRQQIYFAQDPLIFVYKKDPRCKEAIKYEPFTLFSTEANIPDTETDDSKYKGNRSKLIELFEKGSGEFSNCFFTTYVREGGAERSNLNKTFLKTPKVGTVDGLIDKDELGEMKMKKAILRNIQANDFQNKYHMKSLGNGWDGYFYSEANNTSISGVTLVENNWIAFEHWKRSAPAGSITFFPYSFYESNRELFEDINIGTFIPTDPETITDSNNFGDANSDPNADDNSVESSKRRKFVFKKKLYLQYKDNVSVKSEHKEWIKNLLLNNNFLMLDSNLFTPNYCDNSNQKELTESCKDTNKTKANIDIDTLFESKND